MHELFLRLPDYLSRISGTYEILRKSLNLLNRLQLLIRQTKRQILTVVLEFREK